MRPLGATTLLVSLFGVAASWVVPGSPSDIRRRHHHCHRTLCAPVACASETPFRSDDDFDYFRRSREVTIELTKPLGALLEETSAGGVQVADVVEGGSAFETGLLKKRDRLTDISGADVSTASFDDVMEVLSGASAELSIGISRTVIVKVKRVVEAAPYLTIQGGISGDVVKGTILRTAIQDSKSELYRGMTKLTNCGGVGQCRSCIVDVIEGHDNLSPLTDGERKMLAKKPGCRLACQALVNGDVTIEVPA